MRYLIETLEDEMLIGTQLSKWKRQNKITLIEKGDPLEVLKEQQHKIQRSLEILRKAGINKEIIVSYIQAKMPSSMKSKTTIEAVLEKQEEFYKALGITWK